MTLLWTCFRRVLNEPDLPRHGYITETDLYAEGDVKDFVCSIPSMAGQKSPIPVNLERMQQRIPKGPVVANLELGAQMHRVGTGADGLTPASLMRGISHIGVITEMARRMGCQIRGYYQAGFASQAVGEEDDFIAWSVAGCHPLIILDLYGRVDLAWLRRNIPRVERARNLADRTRGKVGVFVAPRTHLGNRAPSEFQQDLLMVQGLKTFIDEFFLFFDGGPERTDFSEVEPFYDVYIETLG